MAGSTCCGKQASYDLTVDSQMENMLRKLRLLQSEHDLHSCMAMLDIKRNGHVDFDEVSTLAAMQAALIRAGQPLL